MNISKIFKNVLTRASSLRLHVLSSTKSLRFISASLVTGKSSSSLSVSDIVPVSHHASHLALQRRNYSPAPESAWTPKRGTNILLMGSPGAGKSSVAKLLSQELNMKYVDVDDHVLEPTWKMTVGEKLAQVGSKDFLDQEAQAFMNFKIDRSIISLTGSQPMNDDAMTHARSLGLMVYLDVDSNDILKRLSDMKVDRIVGQEKGVDMSTILDYRQQFYERHYDIRVICERNESVKSMTNKVINAVNRYLTEKGFSSTRSYGRGNTFMDVTIQGLAPDRGLYVSSAEIPRMTAKQWERLVGMSYTDCALRILEQWIPPTEISHKDLRALIATAYTHEDFGHPDIAPVVPLENNQYMLELFHGPTGSFKDLPLQLTARLFDFAVKKMKNGLRSLILVATSGDTGGAVLNAFSRHTDSCEVVVLFPERGVSSIQKAQLTCMANPRTCVIGLESDFDYCQTAIKDIFTDSKYDDKMRRQFGYAMSAANSINFARLLPQVVYHAWSYLLMVRDGHIKIGDPVDICVPTGNFGNILGAFYAKQMGLPIRHMTVASNSNNVLNEFFTTGVYDIGQRKLMQTSSPAIDILKSSNLERYLFTASGCDYNLMKSLFSSLEETGKFSVPTDSKLFQRIQQDFTSEWCADEDAMKTIKSVFQRTGYMIDPHTSVAKCVADKLQLGKEVPVIISATAHFSKFSDGILDAFGIRTPTDEAATVMKTALDLTEKPGVHKYLWEDVQLPRHHKTVCPPQQENIREHIEHFLNEFYELRSSTRR